MGLTDKIENNTMYLYIIAGTLSQKVTADTPNAKLRTYERTDKSMGEKWEIQHKNLSGFITDIEFNASDFGEQCILKFTDGKDNAQLTFPTDSRYFIDFAQKLSNINTQEKVTINPYDFESKEKKQIRGFSIIQNGEKVESFFWDKDKKCNKNGIPEPKDRANYDGDDWKMFFIKLKKFLKVHVQKEFSSGFIPEITEEKPQHSVNEIPPEFKDDDDSDLPF